jgi:predicted RND superfamily exporter protein
MSVGTAKSSMLPYGFTALFAINMVTHNGHFSEQTFRKFGENLVIVNALGDIVIVLLILLLAASLRRKRIYLLTLFIGISIASSTISLDNLSDHFSILQGALAFVQFGLAFAGIYEQLLDVKEGDWS